jgi:hypothetical protein
MSGQGLVEFSLVAGLFFFVVFSIVNAGFFLYARNAVSYAADVGVAEIAAEGSVSGPPPTGVTPASPGNADQVAISYMDGAGLNHIALVGVTEIDVWKELQNSNGTLSDDTTDCGGPCEDRYSVTGTILNSGGTVPWLPSSRNTSSASGPDFVRLVISYKYQLLLNSATFQMTSSNTFRLEPQS